MGIGELKCLGPSEHEGAPSGPTIASRLIRAKVASILPTACSIFIHDSVYHEVSRAPSNFSRASGNYGVECLRLEIGTGTLYG